MDARRVLPAIAVAIAISLLFGAVVGYTYHSFQLTTIETIYRTTTQIVIQPVPTTLVATSTITQTVNQAQDCKAAFDNGTISSNLVLSGTNSVAVICTRFWYYNSTSALLFSPVKEIQILGHPTNGSGRLNNFSSEFSITSSSSQFQIGGPQVLNEGVAVSFTIALENSSTAILPDGTYYIWLNAILYPQWWNCGGIYIDLFVGHESVPSGPSCLDLYSVALNFNDTFNQYGFLDGVRFVEITGITNGSQTNN